MVGICGNVGLSLEICFLQGVIDMAKKLVIEPVTRIEGHAKISLDVDTADDIIHAHLHVLEIRGFEKFVEHMELSKMPLITARICGVCPAAHHLAAAIAIENGSGVDIPEEAKRLRELLYMGHVLHSHALSCFVLLGPDVFSGIGATQGERTIFHLLSSKPESAKKALKLRSIGQRIVEIVGGRGVHPVTAVPGGMASRPSMDEMNTIIQWGKEAIGILEELIPNVVEALNSLESLRSSAVLNACSAALSRNGIVDFLQGDIRVIDNKGSAERSFPPQHYGDHLVEKVMPGSYMKAVHLKGPEEKRYFVGPLARINVNDSFSTPKATAMMQAFKKSGGPRLSIIDIIEARLIEMVHCAERIVDVASNPPGNGRLRVDVRPHAGRYIGAVEAPRGILIHDYSADDEGLVTAANLIVATQNNYFAIDDAIKSVARHLKKAGNDILFMNGIEFSVRCFDPCLSCATHCAGKMPMIVELRRDGKVMRTITQEAS